VTHCVNQNTFECQIDALGQGTTSIDCLQASHKKFKRISTSVHSHCLGEVAGLVGIDSLLEGHLVPTWCHDDVIIVLSWYCDGVILRDISCLQGACCVILCDAVCDAV
jgi:hypothetical protein